MDADLLITGGRVVDGTGNPWTYADVAVVGDRIAALLPPGSLPPAQARARVDARGMVVCPGFIDIQSHSILPLMIDGRSLSKLTQGVTTEIMGEAWTPAPFGGLIDDPLERALFVRHVPAWAERLRTWRRFGDWLQAMVEHGVSPNIGSFLGGGTLRRYACGMRMGQATPDELATMRRVMAEAMEDGAFGVAYALIYPPDSFVETDELVEVCKVVAAHHGLYITHLRSEADQLIAAIGEALYHADLAQAQQLCAAGRAMAEATGDREQLMLACNIQGTLAWTQGDYAAAGRQYEAGLALARASAAPWMTALALGNLGNLAFHQDDAQAAVTTLTESLALFRTIGDTWCTATVLHMLGRVTRWLGDTGQAEARLLESLALFRTLGNGWGVALNIGGFAAIRVAQGELEAAAELFGAEEALREAVGEPLYPNIRRDHERALEALRSALNEAKGTAMWARGRSLTLEQILVRVR